MSDLTVYGGSAVTMTSLEMVEFINSQRAEGAAELLHKSFLAKVPQVLGEETSAKFLADLPDSYGRSRKGYNFPKREACLMAMSYSYDLQAKVFDKMTELEAQIGQQAPRIPQTLPEALRLAADLAEGKAVAEQKALLLETKVGELAPKAAALDILSTADGSVCISTAAKLLQIRPKDAFLWLSCNRYIFKRHGSGAWIGYQDKIQQGLLEMKTDTVERSDGTKKTVESVLVTPKGLAKLASLIGGKEAA